MTAALNDPTPDLSAPVDLRAVFGRTGSSTWVVTSAQAGRLVGFTAVSIACCRRSSPAPPSP